MALNQDQLVAALSASEPDYREIAAGLGREAGPWLRELAVRDDGPLAARAVSLAAYLPAEVAVPVVGDAAAHPQPAVRVAAAAALAALGEAGREPAARLLADADVGVRAWTLRSLEQAGVGSLRTQVAALAGSDPVPALREQAARLARS